MDVNGNKFAVLAYLDDVEVALWNTAPLAALVRSWAPTTVPEKKISSVPSVAYQTARPPFVPPEYVTELEILHPSVPIRNRRDARKASAMRLGGIFGTVEGSAVITYI